MRSKTVGVLSCTLTDKRCRWKWTLPGLYVSLAICGICAIVLIAYEVQWTVSSRGVDPDSLDSQTFKNTYYTYCSGAVVDPANNTNCPLNSAGGTGRGIEDLNPQFDVMQGSQRYEDSFRSATVNVFLKPMDLKSFCNCFQGWKVLPTRLTTWSLYADGLSLWQQHTAMATGLLYTVLTFTKTEYYDGSGDAQATHISWYQWPLFAYDIATYCIWHNQFPARYLTGMSAFAWITPLKYVFLVGRNPIKGRITCKWRYGNLTLSLYKVIQVLIFAALTIQLAYTIQFIGIDQKTTDYLGGPGYGADFASDTARAELNTQLFDAAPGSTTCQASDLIGFAALNAAVDGIRYSPTQTTSIRLAVFVPYAVAGGLAVWFEIRNAFDSSFSSNPIMRYAIVMVPIFQVIISIYVNAAGAPKAGASITYDLNCTALAIAPSSYRGYLDVAGYNADWRIVRSWFNA